MPDISNFPMDVDALLEYMNIGIIAIIALGALGGFFRGFFKSAYSFIVFVGLLLIGWFLSPVIIGFIMAYDVSSHYQFVVDGVLVTSVNNALPDIIASAAPDFAGVIVEGTIAYQLITQLIFMVLRIVFVIIWLILMVTVFRFFFWIFYLMIKPRNRDETGRRKRKTFVSRLTGMAIGGMGAIVTLILLSIPLSGIFSLGTSLKTVVDTIPMDNSPYTFVLSNSGPNLYDSRNLNNPFEEFEDVFRLFEEYRNTHLGRIGGIVKIGDTPIDLFVFDELFSIKVNQDQVKFRYELAIALSIYTTINNNIEGEINPENLLALDEDVLSSIFEDVAKLKLIKIAIPAGIEIVLNSNLLDEVTQDLPAGLDLQEILEELLEVDFSNEISLIGKAIIDVSKLEIIGNETIGFDLIMGLDGEVVQSLLDNIGSLELVRIAADIGVQVLFAQEGFIQALSDLGLSKEDIDLDGVVWGDEIKNIGTIFNAVLALNITTLEFEEIDFSLITDDAINELAIAIFNSKLLQNNNQLLVTIALNQLPEEFREFITVMNIEANDLAALLSLGKILFEAGVFEEDFDILKLFSEGNIEKMATLISSSKLITGNINGLIQMLLGMTDLPEGLELDIPEDFEWSGESGKQEIIALFTSIGIILELGLGEEDFLDKLTEDKINELADAISESRILMINLGNIIQFMLDTAELPEGLTIDLGEVDWDSEYGKGEFKAILKVVAKLFALGIMDEDFDFATLTKDDIDELADLITASDVFMENVGNILDFVLSGFDEIEIDLGDMDWTSQEGKDEFRALLKAVAIIFEADLLSGDLDNLTDDQIEDLAENLSKSKIIKENLSKIIKEMVADLEFDLDISDDPEIWTKEEISSLLYAARIIMTKQNMPADLFSLTDEELDHILRSNLITDAIIKFIEDATKEDGDLYDLLIIEDGIEWKDTYDNDGNLIAEGELRKLIRSAKILLGDNPDFDDTDNLIDANRILNLSDGTKDTNNDGIIDENDDDEIGELLSSRILLKTIANQIIKLGEGEDAILVVNLNIDDGRWEQEIRNFLIAIKTVLGDEIDLNDINIDANTLKDLTNERGAEDDQVGDILKSIIIADTIIKTIIDLGGDESSLVINLDNEDPRWHDSDTTDGEIRKLIRAISILFGDEDDLNNPDIDPNVILNLTNEDIDTILDSIIAADSIIKIIYDLGQEEDSQIVVSLNLDDPRWYDDGEEKGEIKNLIFAIKIILGDDPDLNNINIDANVLKDLTNERGAEDDQVGDILKSIIITETIIKTIIDLGGDDSSLVINLDNEDPRWRDGVDSDGEIRKLIRAISLLFGEGDDLNNPDIDPNVILDLSDADIDIILDSVIAADSIIKVIYDLGQEEDSQIVVSLNLDDPRWYDDGDEKGEIKNLIFAIKIILGDNPDLNNINIDANILKDLTNARGAEDDQVGDILKSIIITETIIKTIIDLGDKEDSSLIVKLDNEDPRWRDGVDSDGEIRKLIRAISILFGEEDDVNNPNIDANVILDLSDDDTGIILASVIASDSIIKIIYDLGQGEDAQIVVNLTIDDPRWYDDGDEKGELRHLIRAIKIILGENPDLNNINIDANVLKDLTNDRGEDDDEVGDILKSIIITDTIIKTIIDLDGDDLIINLDKEDPRWRDSVDSDGEIRRLIRAISIIFGDEDDLNNPAIDPNVVLNLSDEEIGIILASVIASDSIIKQIYDLGQGDDPIIIIVLSLDDERWYDTETEEGELRRFIRAIKVILGDNADLNNVSIDANILLTLSLGEVDPDDDDVAIIQASIIARDTIINKIIEIGTVAPGEDATLIVSLDQEDPRWLDSEDGPGEIRRLIKAVQLIFNKPTDDLNNPNLDPNIILELSDGTKDTNNDGIIDENDDDDLGQVLKSIIISDTIINKLIELGQGEGAVLIIDLAADDPRWHDDNGNKGEIRNFVKAVEIVLDPGIDGVDLNNPVIKSQSDILRLDDEEITVLLNSLILSKTIVREIIANDELTIPETLQDINAPEWYNDGETIGELHKLIKVISIIMDEGTTNMNTTKILNMTDEEIDTILDSLIAKETIKKEIREMDALVVDEDHPDFEWEDTFVGEVRIDGELRKLLNSASLLIENDEVNIDKILTLSVEEIDILVLSRIIVDSTVDKLKELTGPTGSLHNVLYLPEDGDVSYHGVNGELKYFFIAIQHIKEGNTTPEQGIEDIETISLASLTGENQSEILASKIISNTIITNIINESNRVGSPLKLPAKYIKGDPLYDASAWDLELPRFIDAIQVFVGDSSLDQLDFTVDDFLNLSDGTVDPEDDEILTLTQSEILSYTVVSEIINESNRPGSMVLIPANLQEEDWYGNDGELRKFLMAVSSLTTNGLEVEDTKFLNLTDGEIDRIVASRVLSYSIVNRIEDERNNPVSLISLPDKFNPDKLEYDEELWYGNNGELTKTLKALRGLGMTTFDADFSIRPLFDEAKGLTDEVILASEVVEKTIINKIETESQFGGSLYQTLIIPVNVVWEKQIVNDIVTDIGELRRFLSAIDIILGNDELENASFNVEKFFDPTDQDVLLSSLIIEASVINKIDTEAADGGSLHGKLVYPSDWDQAEWYGVNGELRRFLTSIEIIIGNDTFETTTFEADKFLGAERTTLLASRIVEASVVEYIIDSADPVDGVLKESLYLPDGYETNNPNWYGINGELNRFLDAIKLIVGEGTYATANFEVDTILGDDRPTLLASKVVEASVVQYVIESAEPGGSLAGSLIIPVDLQTNNEKWYGVNGELVRFLDSISIIIGEGTYATANFEVDTILGDDQDTILESRVVEASVVHYVMNSNVGLIFPSNVNPYYYLSDETIIWERTFDNDDFVTDIGELRRFLAGVSEIIGDAGTFATIAFDMNLMLTTDFSKVLDSRVLEATIANMVDDLITNVLTGFIKQPDDGYQWFYHGTSTDLISGEVRRGEFELTIDTNQYSDLLGFLTSIQEMDKAGLNFNNITIENVVACDSEELATAFWDFSRIMRGSMATLMNKIFEPFPVNPWFPKPVYQDGDFTSKQNVIDTLNEVKWYYNLPS